jgi:hypothetical protein
LTIATPAGFEGRAERAERETTEREREDQARRAKARQQEEQARIDAYWQGLTPEQQARLDAEALEQADPARRAEIEGETRPFMKRLLMSAVRDAHLKSILNVPVAG